MNKWVLASGVLSAILLLLHVIGGGANVHRPMLEGGLSTILAAYASVLWHGITGILLVNTGALIVAARKSLHRQVLVWMVAAQYLAFAGVFVFYGLNWLGNLYEMPQWTIFLAISGVALWGLRDEGRSSAL